MNLDEYIKHGFEYYKIHLGRLVVINKPSVFISLYENETNKILIPKNIIDEMLASTLSYAQLNTTINECYLINKPIISMLVDVKIHNSAFMFGFLIEKKIYYLVRNDPMYLIKYVKLM